MHLQQSKGHESHVLVEELRKEWGGHSHVLLSKFLIRGEGQSTLLEEDVQAVQLGKVSLQLTQEDPAK